MPTTTSPDAADRAAAFEQLVAAHRGIIVKIAASYCRDPHDRADLAEPAGAARNQAVTGNLEVATKAM